MDSIANQNNKVDEQQRPERIDLYHFEARANKTHYECWCCPFPDFDLT